MSMQELTKHLWNTSTSKKEPKCVWLAVLRNFYLETLGQAGHDRAILSSYSTGELEELWNTADEPKDFDPHPTAYVFGSCYTFLMVGIADHSAMKFVVTETKFQGFDEDDHIVFQPGSRLLFFKGVPIDYVSPMYFIGMADEVIRPYICEFHWNRVSTTLAFDLNQKQIREIREVIEEMRKK